MHSSFEKIVRTKPRLGDKNPQTAKASKKLRKQQREAKRHGGVLPDKEA